ncbi:MAG: hypothetical protein P4L84_11330 [Isosphaeraceae bacterium]|nr:hypothetical protein [Isosphaeraceae bacterium]
MAALLIHVEYIIWAGHATRLANFDWARRRGTALHLFSVKDLHFHLYETGVEEGWITAPKKRKHPYSYYVAQAFNWNAEQVKQEARQYWRLKIKEQSQ